VSEMPKEIWAGKYYSHDDEGVDVYDFAWDETKKTGTAPYILKSEYIRLQAENERLAELLVAARNWPNQKSRVSLNSMIDYALNARGV